MTDNPNQRFVGPIYRAPAWGSKKNGLQRVTRAARGTFEGMRVLSLSSFLCGIRAAGGNGGFACRATGPGQFGVAFD